MCWRDARTAGGREGERERERGRERDPHWRRRNAADETSNATVQKESFNYDEGGKGGGSADLKQSMSK